MSALMSGHIPVHMLVHMSKHTFAGSMAISVAAVPKYEVSRTSHRTCGMNMYIDMRANV